ncbi:serine--tRNA ligase [Patescibacteria group bacterium]|nr:serine--tRNA ligase [Patescibacteria group bacterium]
MLDINYIREHAADLKTAIANKQLNPSIVDQVLSADEQRRELIVQVETVRQQINENTNAIKNSETKRPTEEQLQRGRELKAILQDIEPQLKQVEETLQDYMYQVANPPAADVPIGKDESGNEVVKQVGEQTSFPFKPQDHEELMLANDLLDIKRAVRIAGFRAYFLKNEAVMLEQALLQHAFQFLAREGFTPMTVPWMVNKEALWGTGYFPWGIEDHYTTQDNQGLIGTAEVSLTAYRQDEVLNEKDLPYKMVGISPCFRREVGSHGKDVHGIIRVHQFTKVEQVVYTVADEDVTREWHQKMVGYAEQLLQDLELPYQVLLMCTGDMGAGQRKKYDIETWFPAQQKYRETHSASYFNDFQARRLNIKYRAKDGSMKHVYTLNNTMAASPRLLAAVIENYQNEDGSIRVPKLLQEAMGMNVISRKA